jgi:metal-responsive CopG/Arc/MetJ family transcriptional regulator
MQMAFQLKPDKKQTENKTIRFPLELIEEIENAIQNQHVTFSRFVIQACQYALENMEEKTEDTEENKE